NDWSARDIQSFEYQPLGPFLAKSFATSISPFIVTLEALAPFRGAWHRAEADPQPLAYLDSGRERAMGAYDIELQVLLQTRAMAEGGKSAEPISRSNFRHAYWSIAQMLAHHSVNGCMLRAGDLLGTGTQSGPEQHQGGALIELTRGGQTPIALGNGERRAFLHDGDRVTLRGWCERPGFRRIGFGEVSACIEPAVDAD
ncbi:MAG: fumarylacetoacetate hydrolase family protein, partial [Gammaproteobacteria bacterium]|nr:fumarylacetoacetate hydrolase family protein [Gammaproteobacteria bacterium]